jgi:hypothetical protein
MIIGFSHQIIALANDDSTDIFELINRWQRIRQGDRFPPPAAKRYVVSFGPG